MDNLLTRLLHRRARRRGAVALRRPVSIGIMSSLKGVGYGTPRQPMPVVSGQDAEVPSVKSILAGEQTSTIFKDTRELAKVAANMVDAVLSGGKQPEINDTKTYKNGVKVVPSYLLKPVERRQVELEAGADRQRLLQGRAVQVRLPRTQPRASGAGYASPMAGRPRQMRRRSCDRGNVLTRRQCDGRYPRNARHQQELPGRQGARDVNLAVKPARSTPIVGENGAGKSTLMKVLSGVYPYGTYEGEILFEGEERRFRGIRDSEHVGIIIIHQELALVPLLSIAENIFLGNEPARCGVIDWYVAFAQHARAADEGRAQGVARAR